MISVFLHKISFSYTDANPLFDDVTLQLTSGFTGIVGANGSGKSTLLRLISGELLADTGAIQFSGFYNDPPEIRLCEQQVSSNTPEIFEFANATDGSSRRLIGQLQIVPNDLNRWNTLSPGERKRWQVGAALASSPDILLLDEPTNHLDKISRELLLRTLMQFSGIGLLVSHDRNFLDAVTIQTLRIQQKSLQLFPGGYQKARQLWEAEEKQHHQSFLGKKQEHKKTKNRLRQKQEKRKSAEKDISPKRRMKNIRDHDARSMTRKGKAQKAEKRLGRDVGVLRKQLEQKEDALKKFSFQKKKGRSIFLAYEAPSKSCLFSLHQEALYAGEKLILENLSLSLRREEKVWLQGENGSGKTTLLHKILETTTLPEQKYLYLPQELSAEEEKNLFESLSLLPATEKSQVFSMLAALGVDPDKLLCSEKPSPGEVRKLMMAYGLGKGVWALLLDEPTNHLDLPSIERLENSLTDYPGALILVSHDETFAKRCTNRSWQITKKQLTICAIENPESF